MEGRIITFRVHDFNDAMKQLLSKKTFLPIFKLKYSSNRSLPSPSANLFRAKLIAAGVTVLILDPKYVAMAGAVEKHLGLVRFASCSIG
jgi:hypothetical protein